MKVLVVGEVKGRLDLLFDRVATLNASRAGPFDVLFCMGEFYPPADAADTAPACTAFEDYLCGAKEVPLATYFIEAPSATAEKKYGTVTPGEELCGNCKYLGAGGLELVGKLAVGFLSQQHTDKDIEKILGPASSSTFMGTDIFLSTHWGQRIGAGYDLTSLIGTDQEVADVGSSTVADLAVLLRPRYHFAAQPSVFFQRPPYRNHTTPPKTKLSHITRFISLAEVSESKDKAKKWLHAINIEALPYMTLEALIEEPADITDSPYTVFAASSSNNKRAGEGGGGGGGGGQGGLLKKFRGGTGGEGVGISHEAMQAIQKDEENKRADAGTFFWGGGKGRGGRGGGGGGGGREHREVDPNNTTVFIGKLPAGYAVQDLQRNLSHYGKIVSVRMPVGKDFAFVIYTTHEEAQAAIESGGITLGVAGLQLSWAKSATRSTPPAGVISSTLSTSTRVSAGSPVGGDVGGGGGGGGGHYGPASLQPDPVGREGRGGRGGGGRGGEGEMACWFCLGSPKVELELLVTIGESFYMAVPKGPLNPEHVLLIPIKHVAGLAQVTPKEWAEFEKYKVALRDMYAEKGMRVVLFERRLETRGAKHTHVQVVPVPEAKAADVREAFETKGEPFGVFFEHLPAGKGLPELGLSPDQQYMYVELPGLGGHGVARLLHRLPEGGRLPITYGRDVLCDMLEVPEKLNWKDCELSKPEETEAVDRLKASWAKYDFNEEEE